MKTRDDAYSLIMRACHVVIAAARKCSGASTFGAYVRAGVTALLFGGGADGTTSEKTDGGWFLAHARAYYRGR